VGVTIIIIVIISSAVDCTHGRAARNDGVVTITFTTPATPLPPP